MIMRTLAKELNSKSGKVNLAGWVNSRRDHGGLIFIDLRDHTGIIQLVVDPNTANAFKLAETLRDEFVIKATGTVRKRGAGLENPNIPTGDIEVVVEDMELLNRSEPLPVSTHDEGVEAGEEIRLKYRYLDMRRPKMQNRLIRRSEYYRFMRDYMHEHEFIEVTTPILANSSPEGARDFLIPSRLRPGMFYALPQAPQQFKQLSTSSTAKCPLSMMAKPSVRKWSHLSKVSSKILPARNSSARISLAFLTRNLWRNTA